MTPADYAARIVELEHQLALTREAIKPFTEFIKPRGSVANNEIVTITLTAKECRRLAACGNAE